MLKDADDELLDEWCEDEREVGEWVACIDEGLAEELVRYVYENHELVEFEKDMPEKLIDMQRILSNKIEQSDEVDAAFNDLFTNYKPESFTVSFPKDELGALFLKNMEKTGSVVAMEKDLECAVCLMYIRKTGKECPECEKITCLNCYRQLLNRNDK